MRKPESQTHLSSLLFLPSPSPNRHGHQPLPTVAPTRPATANHHHRPTLLSALSLSPSSPPSLLSSPTAPATHLRQPSPRCRQPSLPLPTTTTGLLSTSPSPFPPSSSPFPALSPHSHRHQSPPACRLTPPATAGHSRPTSPPPDRLRRTFLSCENVIGTLVLLHHVDDLITENWNLQQSQEQSQVLLRSKLEEERRKRIEAERDLSSMQVSQVAAIVKLELSIDKVTQLRKELKAVDKRDKETEEDRFNKGIVSGFDELEEFYKMLFSNFSAQKLDLKSLSSYSESRRKADVQAVASVARLAIITIVTRST